MTARRFFILLSIVMLVAGPSYIRAQKSASDEVTFEGKRFAVLKVGKDDSLFGIAQRMNWDYDTLALLNPDVATQLQKGMKVFYPMVFLPAAVHDRMPEAMKPDKSVIHLVQKGDNIYNVAKMYGVTPDDIYAADPRTKDGLFPGMEIIIPVEGQWLYYTLNDDENLYDLAKRNQSTVSHILRDNPGLGSDNLKKGTVVRIPVGSDSINKKLVPRPHRFLKAFRLVKTQKDDSWAGIAATYDISLDSLMALNPEVKSLKKSAFIAIPEYEDKEVLQLEVTEDPRQNSPEGIKEIYNEVNNTLEDGVANIALIVDNPTTKRDKDFLRGFLLAVEQMKNSGNKINLKVIDNSRTPIADSLARIDDVDLIITTFENNRNGSTFPDTLAYYALGKNIEIVNVYDMKNELYMTLPNMLQLVTPSDYFNEAVAQYISSNFTDHFLISVGKPEDGETDLISQTIMRALGRSALDLSPEEFEEYSFSPGDKYFVYSYATKKDDFKPVAEHVAAELEKKPELDITLFGKPNLVLFADGMKDKLGAAHVQFPSRMYFDDSNAKSKEFLAQYQRLYSQKPEKLFPLPAVMGYDVANVFIPSLVFNNGDFNLGFSHSESLQMPLDLQRINNWGGIFNPSSLIVKFLPENVVETIVIQ